MAALGPPRRSAEIALPSPALYAYSTARQRWASSICSHVDGTPPLIERALPSMVCAPAVRLGLALRQLLCWTLNSTSFELSQLIALATAGSSLPLYGVICMIPRPLSKLRVVSGSLLDASCIAVASRI